MHERAQVVEGEFGRVREKSRDLALKTAPLAWSGISPERSQRALGGAGLGKNVFMQISGEDPVEFREG